MVPESRRKRLLEMMPESSRSIVILKLARWSDDAVDRYFDWMERVYLLCDRCNVLCYPHYGYDGDSYCEDCFPGILYTNGHISAARKFKPDDATVPDANKIHLPHSRFDGYDGNIVANVRLMQKSSGVGVIVLADGIGDATNTVCLGNAKTYPKWVSGMLPRDLSPLVFRARAKGLHPSFAFKSASITAALKEASPDTMDKLMRRNHVPVHPTVVREFEIAVASWRS